MTEPYILRLRLAIVHGTTSSIQEDVIHGDTLADLEVLGQARFDELLQRALILWRDAAP